MTHIKALKKAVLSVLMLPFLLCTSGCVYLVVGGIGAVGGYIVSPDTVEGLTDADEITVWDTAVEIVSIMGLIQEKNEDTGAITARVNNANVEIRIVPLNDNTTKLTIKARKMFLPKISVAQDVFVKIMSALDE